MDGITCQPNGARQEGPTHLANRRPQDVRSKPARSQPELPRTRPATRGKNRNGCNTSKHPARWSVDGCFSAAGAPLDWLQPSHPNVGGGVPPTIQIKDTAQLQARRTLPAAGTNFRAAPPPPRLSAGAKGVLATPLDRDLRYS